MNSRNRLSNVILTVIVPILAACSAGSNIRSDYDKTADFSNYRTYGFIEGAGPAGEEYQSLFTQYMIAAISKEMESRGYKPSLTPDLLINFNAVLREKTSVSQTPVPAIGGYYGYRRGFYDPWGSYSYGTQTSVSQYTEGTFNIDIVDAKRKQLVWEAVGVGRITENKLRNLEQAVQQGVPKFFAHYPFRAPAPLPRPIK